MMRPCSVLSILCLGCLQAQEAVAGGDVDEHTKNSSGVPLSIFELADPSHGKPWDVLTYGFSPDDSAIQPNMVRRVNKIFTYTEDDISLDSNSWVNGAYTVDVYDSEEQASITFSLDMGLPVDTPAFAASVKSSTDRCHSTSNKVYRADCTIRAQKYTATANHLLLENHVHPDVKELIRTRSAAAIVEGLGALFPTTVDLGGLLRTTVIKERTKSDEKEHVESSIKADYKLLVGTGISGAPSAADDDDNTQSTHALHARTLVQGGDPNIWFGVTPKMFDSVKQKWIQSLTDDNMYALDFSFSPMWHLVELFDAKKAEEVKDYLMSKWGKELAQLQQMDKRPYAQEETTPPPAPCEYYTGGSCHIFGCASSRSATCDSGHCVCQQGTCAEAGVCKAQGGCDDDTGGTCRVFDCAQWRGPTQCVDGKCLCPTGFCVYGDYCTAAKATAAAYKNVTSFSTRSDETEDVAISLDTLLVAIFSVIVSIAVIVAVLLHLTARRQLLAPAHYRPLGE